MITPEQRQLRRGYLGASDAAAALGLSPYKSPVELALEKRGELVEDESIGDSLAVRLGNAMERGIVDAAAEQIGVSVIYDEMMVHPDGVLACNFDAIGLESVGDKSFVPIEAKYAESRDQWGPADAGLDGIPQHYAVQVCHQVLVAQARRGFLAAYFSGRGRELRIYEIAPPAEMLTALERTLVDWWNRHVIGGERPAQEEPCSLDVLSRRIRQPGKTTEVDPGLVSHWLELADAERRYARGAAAAKARVIEALGDAEAGTVGGTEVITYREQKRKEFVSRATKFRVLRATKAVESLRPAAAQIGGVA